MIKKKKTLENRQGRGIYTCGWQGKVVMVKAKSKLRGQSYADVFDFHLKWKMFIYLPICTLVPAAQGGALCALRWLLDSVCLGYCLFLVCVS